MVTLALVLKLIPALFGALIPVFMLIPGPHPEKEMQAIVDFIEKFSRK